MCSTIKRQRLLDIPMEPEAISEHDAASFLTGEKILSPDEVLDVNTLGPVGTSSEAIAKKYLDESFFHDDGKVHLFDSFEDARQALTETSVLLVPSAYANIKNFFFDTDISLVDCFTDYSLTYYLYKYNEEESDVIYIHDATESLAIAFLEEQNLQLKIKKVKSTSLAAKIANDFRSYCICNKNAGELHKLTQINEGFRFKMTWNVFYIRKK